MKWLREALFGNWRNKGVAMFFAITIWFVAYQSEKQEQLEEYSVEFMPEDPKQTVITAVRASMPQREGGAERRFDGKIRMRLSGPRKLIAETRERFALRGRALPPFVIPPDKSFHKFSEDDFDFAGKGLAILSFSPEAVWITQDARGAKLVKDLDAPNRLNVTNRLEGHQILSSRVEPQQVRIEGPASVLGSVDVWLTFSMELRERHEGLVKVVPVFSDETVPEYVREKVRPFPDSVKVQVTTQAQVKTLSLDGVRISFRVRMPKVAFSIVSDDFDPVSGTIPVELYGPQDEIERIEELHAKNALVLSVPVRPIQPDQESIRTFGESDLELYGFPKVQVRQHESRRDKGPWSYRIVPVVEKTEP